MNSEYLLGIDTGGTFTDFILIRPDKGPAGIQLHKVLSTPQAPEEAILTGIHELGLDKKINQLRIIHGTTVATNAALESKGVRTAFITNRGFSDLLSIGRQAREELYNLQPSLNKAPVAKDLCLETGGRLSSQGEELEPLTEEDLDCLEEKIKALKPDAIAINLLFSFLNGDHERRIEERLRSYSYVCRSSVVLPEMREYERGIATWYNAYLGPLVANYFRRLKTAVSPAPVSIMQSSGGTIALDQAADKAVNLLLSGPAGGLAAAAFMGNQKSKEADKTKMLSFDMGGTSTDVAMIDGTIKLTNEGKIGRYPIAVPMVDMHTIGAGGGSIAYLDSASMLHVGPESAGANPGPACYGQGGTLPTVTDANAVLGRLQADNFLGGNMTLNTTEAQKAVGSLAKSLNLTLEECALGIIELANEHMSQALRVISEQRGHDPADYQLVGFGGAGGLHICALADSIGIGKAMVPVYGGVFSAFGMLVAPQSRELSLAYLVPLKNVSNSKAEEKFEYLASEAIAALEAEGVARSEVELKKSVHCRYSGQSFTLDIDWSNAAGVEAAFHQAHQSAYGHKFYLPVEAVSLRLSASSKPSLLDLKQVSPPDSTSKPYKKPIWAKNSNKDQLEKLSVDIYDRKELRSEIWISGPALICETSATIWVESGWKFKLDALGNIELLKYSTQDAEKPEQ